MHTIQRITDIIQAIDLVAFTAALLLAAGISWRWPRWRWPLLPVMFYALNGTIFYMVVVLELTNFRTLWSAALRLQGSLSILTALIVLAWRLRRSS